MGTNRQHEGPAKTVPVGLKYLYGLASDALRFFTFIEGIAFPKGSGEVPSLLAPTHLPQLQNIQRMFRPAGENGMVDTHERGSFSGDKAVCRTGREASMKGNHVE